MSFKEKNLAVNNSETSSLPVAWSVPLTVSGEAWALEDALTTSALPFAGRLVASLVAEFLQFFNLDFTLAVFQPETSTVRMMIFTSTFVIFARNEFIIS